MHGSLARSRALAHFLLVTCAAVGVTRAQPAPPLDLDLEVTSGWVANDGDEPAVVFSTTVEVPDAAWLRLTFAQVVLAGSPEDGSASWLRLTSLTDGAEQFLYANHLEEWDYSSAYFNGPAVLVELIAHPGTGPNHVTIVGTLAGWPVPPQETICGPTDDRVLSADPRLGRGQSIDGQARCTAFLINDCNRCLFTAGHCFAEQIMQVHFNVPLSDPNGTPQFPPPKDQYAIDPNSWHVAAFDMGNDWGYFGCFPNPNTGLTPSQAQGAPMVLSTALAGTGETVRVSGYGTVDLSPAPPPNEWNRALTTGTGLCVGASSTLVRHTVDTTDGNSGSPILRETTGEAIGIHTHGGCDASAGDNSGTSVAQPGLQAGLGTPRGVCVPTLTLKSPHVSHGYYGTGPSALDLAWPVPLRFAIVANRDDVPAVADDGKSFLSAVRFTLGTSTCLDSTASGDQFDCALTAPSGVLDLKAEGLNPWGQSVVSKSVRVLLLGATGPVTQACWLAGTKVRMADGSLRVIETLNANDQVMAYNLLDGEWSATRVSKVYSHPSQPLWDKYLVINGTIRVTPDHLLYVNNELRFAGQVAVGETLTGPGGSMLVTSVQTKLEQAATYNLELAALPQPCVPYVCYEADGLLSYPLKGGVVSMLSRLLYAYELEDVGRIPPAASSIANGINEDGQVVGESVGRAFIWSHADGMTDLGLGSAYAVNKSKRVVGTSGGQAVVWEPDGSKTVLGAGVAYDINDSGVIVGQTGGTAIRWQPGPVWLLGPGAIYAVNAAGEMAGVSGTKAVRWSPTGVPTDLGPGVAYDINNAGEVVGETAGKAFHWKTGTLTQIGTGKALAINDAGLVGGQSGGTAFLWSQTLGFAPLSQQIWRWSGWTPQAVRDINAFGELAGDGLVWGEQRGFQGLRTNRPLDADGDGVPDVCGSGLADCDGNGVPDQVEIAAGNASDCNGNGLPDDCELDAGMAADCNGNGVPDECDLADGTSADCNHNGVPDECDIASGFAKDCNGNGIPDSCDIASGFAKDCNGNGIPDSCDIASGFAKDCNGNGIPDSCDIASGFAKDCNGNGIPDSCDIASGFAKDCNGNGIPDSCDIASGFAKDCNGNGIPDSCDIASGFAKDCNGNGVPDSCDIASGFAKDCNGNGIPDSCDIASGFAKDCNGNGIPDSCELDSGAAEDCNGNNIPDECDIASGTSHDLNSDGIPDECQDCNRNGVPDGLDIQLGTSLDLDGNGLPDECQTPDPASAPLPPDGATGVVIQPTLSALVKNSYGGAMTVSFLHVGAAQSWVVTSEADWAGGTSSGAKTDGAGSLVLEKDQVFYGNGSDGDLILTAGSIAMLSDRQYKTVVIGPGATLDTRGFLLRVSDKLTNQGTITDSASGGAGGAGGLGGQGHDPKQDDSPPGPTAAQPGQCGQAGSFGPAGAGRGGTGGGGGGGGGGASWSGKPVDADGGWFPTAPATDRGRGGNGGKGGGLVRIHAAAFDNIGVIHADAQPGAAGQPGGNAEYYIEAGADLAGGGGGGGAGGNGGDGGSVLIHHMQLLNTGTLRALGGGPGNGGLRGNGKTLVYGVPSGLATNGASGTCGGGNGGKGEIAKSKASGNGTNGSPGASGAAGTASISAHIVGYAASATYLSALHCAGGTADWTGATLSAIQAPGTTVSIQFSTGDGTWYDSISQVPDSTCIRFRLTLTTSDPLVTPSVQSVTIDYATVQHLQTKTGVPSGTRPAFTWSGLQPDKTYCWQVIATDPVGPGPVPSPLWCFKTGGGAPCPADLYPDGKVDQQDLGVLLANYGCVAGPGACPGDISGDGKTDQIDLGFMLSAYGKPCP